MKNMERMRGEINKRMETIMGEIIKILDEMNSKGVVKGGAKGRLEASK
jgi:hypothetical protein